MSAGTAGGPGLDGVVHETMATMAFAYAVPVPGERLPAGDLVAMRLALEAPQRGTLWLLVDRATLTVLATDAWGVAGLDQDPDGTLFLAEVTNVVAGRLLAARAPDADVRMGLPEVASPGEVGPEDELWVYDVDGARLTVALHAA